MEANNSFHHTENNHIAGVGKFTIPFMQTVHDRRLWFCQNQHQGKNYSKVFRLSSKNKGKD